MTEDTERQRAVAGLPVPATAEGRAGLAALIADPERALIAVDFDGTLAPIIDDPAAARATPDATRALTRLAGRAGTVAIITGRPAADAASFAGVASVPGVIVLGHYGMQRFERGTVSSPPPPPGLSVARAELPAVLSAAGADPGTWIEDKGDALAVHTRRAPRPDAELGQLRAPLAELAARTGLALEPGGLRRLSFVRRERTRGARSLPWHASGHLRRSCSAATTSATGPRSPRCASCARTARRGCWSAAAPLRCRSGHTGYWLVCDPNADAACEVRPVAAGKTVGPCA